MFGFKRILIIRLSAIGDVVNVLPATTLLRDAFPDAKITFAVERPASSLLQNYHNIDEVFVIDRGAWIKQLTNPLVLPEILFHIIASFSELRKRQFDLCIDFQGNFRSAIISLVSGSRVRIGFSCRNAREMANLFYTRTVKLPRRKMLRAIKNIQLLQSIGITPRSCKAEFSFSEQERVVTDEFFRTLNLNGRMVAAIHAGTSKFGAFKRWSEKGYAEVCKRLMSEFGISPVLTYGPNERETVEKINLLSGNMCIIAPQIKGLKELAYFLKRSSLFIGADTGPMHIAAAVGTPIIAIFGPKDPQIYAPYSSNYIIVRKQIPCSPCEKRSCSHLSCLKLVTADDVIAAVKKIVKEIPFKSKDEKKE